MNNEEITPPQPEPNTGEEWRVEHFTKDGADEWMVVTKTGRSVALANVNDSRLAEAEMRQIVSDHTRAALMSKLVAALEMLTCRGCEESHRLERAARARSSDKTGLV